MKISELKKLDAIFKRADLGFSYFLIPVLLTLLGAASEVFSVGLFIPIFKGLSSQDYSFLRSYSVSNYLIELFPFIVGGSPFRTFTILSCLVGFGILFKVLLTTASRLSLAHRSRMLAHRLRVAAFKRYVSFGKQYFDTHQVGEVQTIIDGFSVQLSEQLYHGIILLCSVIPVIFYAIAMMAISWQATLLLLIVAPCFWFFMAPIARNMLELSREQSFATMKFGASLQRVLRGISIVKVSNTEALELQEIEKASDLSRELHFSLSKKSILADMYIQLAIVAGVGLISLTFLLVFRASFVENMAGCIVYMYLLRLTVDVARSANRLVHSFSTVVGLAESLGKPFETTGKFILESGEVKFEGLTKQIDVCGLSFAYPGNPSVLDDLNFSIEKGTVVAVVGPSGSGKSTLIQLLLRLYDPPRGTIFYDGIDICDLDTASFRRGVSYVSQKNNLLEDTLRNNLTYGCFREISEEEIRQACKSARLEEVVHSLPFGLETIIGNDGIRLSGGEAQRVSIARAILKGSEFLILDEATSALDATTEKEIQDAINELVVGKTVVVIAHRFSTLQNADKVIAIKNGRIVEQGSVDDLLNDQGLFASLWKAQELERVTD